MSDNAGSGGLRGRLRPSSGAGGGRVGDPNVLTGAAKPNQLSDQTAPSKPVAVSTSSVPASPKPAATPTQTWTPTPTRLPTPSPSPSSTPRPMSTPVGADEPVRRRVPPLPTLLFLGFLVLTGIRLFNEFAQGFGSAGPTPTPAAAGPATPKPIGSVTFGTDMSDDCEVSGAATTFPDGTDVWWLAEMPVRQSKDAVVVVHVLFNHDQISRDVWPPDGSSFWTYMCDGPIGQDDIGNYRIEVWNEDETVLQAAGDFQIR